MGYHFLEDIAIADIAFEAWGKDLEELFIAAGDATVNTMVDNLEAIEATETRSFELEDDALDMLLFNFLQEFIYYKDSEFIGKVAISGRGRIPDFLIPILFTPPASQETTHFLLTAIVAGIIKDLSGYSVWKKLLKNKITGIIMGIFISIAVIKILH